MSFSVQTSGTGASLKKVSLLGSVVESSDSAGISALLEAVDAQAVEISCFDADTLPVELIEAIAASLTRGVEVKVHAYRPLLAFSLQRLALPVLQVTPQLPQARLACCRSVALAGSAHSLDKILCLVEALPESAAAVFIVQQLQEDQPNLLDRLLKVRTGYQVCMPQHLTPIKPHTIYIAPPGHHMKVAHGLVYLTRDRKISYVRPSIDALFESLAAEYGADLLVVLLCGFGQDGVAGCALVRAAGGCVLVEEGSECEGANRLPDSAISAGYYDHLLKHRAIASIAAAAVSERSRTLPDSLLDLFLEALFEHTGYDFRSYQRATLQHRINHQMRLYASFFDFQCAVLSEPEITKCLLAELSINVTEFFRHPEQFQKLRDEILPYLASFPLIKIWSAGCATGEEAYSLAILLDELGLLHKSHIFATDINLYLLELASAGLYPIGALNQSSRNYAESGGKEFSRHLEVHDRYLKVAQRYRERVLFHHHALGQDGVFNEFQIILCRNVMIYFEPELQRRVFGLFARSLHREGFLLLGPNDGMQSLAQQCQFKTDGAHIYRYAGSQS